MKKELLKENSVRGRFPITHFGNDGLFLQRQQQQRTTSVEDPETRSGIMLCRATANSKTATTGDAGDPRQKLSGMTGLFITAGGFTLIELLVVILIIAILAAVALPQYNKAVERSRAAQGIALVRSFGQAASAEYLRTGQEISSLNNLDVSLSDEKKTEFVCSGIASACNKKEWGVGLYNAVNNTRGVVAWRTNGRYKGSGFAMYYEAGSSGYKANMLYCIERNAGTNKVEKHEYCEKVMQGTYVSGVNNSWHYLLP